MEMLVILIAILVVKLGEGIIVTMRKNREEKAAVLFFRASHMAKAEGYQNNGNIWNQICFKCAVQWNISELLNPFSGAALFRHEGDNLIRKFLQLEKGMAPDYEQHREEVREAVHKNLEKAAAISLSLKEVHPLIADEVMEMVLWRLILDRRLPDMEVLHGSETAKVKRAVPV